MYSEFAEILKKHKVFLGPSYPNLRHVEIGYGKGANPPEASDEYWAYVLGIAHKVRGLSICSSFDFPTALERMLDGSMMSNIRYFKLDSVNLTFNSFCSLVEKLPNMTQFSVLGLTLNSEHGYMSHVELHDRFTSKYRTLSHSLQYCDATGGGDLNEMVKCAMLLVALCPRIIRFKANMPMSKSVQDAINKATAKEPFIRYADRLKHLAFNEITEDSDAFASF
ncbi:hypothetical protein GGH92_005209 [Coemansia sp. RSA 2673]|nr:hypothetical protein GGH92_005209 [Coemansia sp. RSA 2673]